MEVAIVLSTILFVILTVFTVTKASIPNPVYINERGKWFLFILTYREDIYFFEVNTKYISSSVLKQQNFHECVARVKISMFEIYLVFTKKSKCSFYFYTF